MRSCEALVHQLYTGSRPRQHLAVAALSVLPLTTSNWLSAVSTIPRLVQLLRSTPTTTPRARAIRRLLENISTSCQYEDGLGVAPDGVLPSLVSMLLRDDNPGEQHVAVLTLGTLAMNAGNQLNIVEAGAIKPLVQLLKDSLVEFHHPAAEALGFLAEHCGVGARIIAAGGLRPLLHLLGSNTVAVQQSAVELVRMLACENSNPVAAAGAIPLMVQLLASSSADVQEEAAQVLGYLARDADIIAQIVTAGAIPLLVGLLSTSSSSSTEVLRQEAANTLALLSVGAQSEVIAAGAVEPLVGLLKSDSEDTLTAASLTLLYLSNGNAAALAEVAAAGAIAPLVRVLQAADSEDLQVHTAMLLAKLAYVDAKSVVRAGAIPALVDRLASGSPSVVPQERAALALSVLANDADNHAAILAAAPLFPLVHQLASISEDTEASAAEQVLLLLSDAPTFSAQFVAAGAIPPLVRLLRSESAVIQVRALLQLGLLTRKSQPASQICVSVKSAGALPLLAHIQTAATSSEAMQYNAGQLLQTLTKGTSQLADPQMCSPSTAMSSTAYPESAAVSSSAEAGVALPPSAASPQQQQQQQPPRRPRKRCWSCDATDVPLKKCSVCAVAAYCGASCQKADWKAHKGQCAGLKAGATGSGSSAGGGRSEGEHPNIQGPVGFYLAM